MSKSKYQDITTAPKDGTVIRIRGNRFNSSRRYYATAVWATRCCPKETTGWFPPERDGWGPFNKVTAWKIEPVTAGAM